jgi:ferritin
MLDKKMLNELNQQIQEETYNSYIYLTMARGVYPLEPNYT